MVRYPNRAPTKAHSKYRGPFLVQDKLGDTYICQDLLTQKPLSFHADRIVPYHSSENSSMSPFDVASRDRQEYTIDYISSHDGNPKKRSTLSFLVHWLGYEEEEATWEPYKNIQDTVAFEDYIKNVEELQYLL
jgi:hypothetical protein